MRYLDHAAATPMRSDARAAMAELGPLANPSSTHRAGQRAQAVLEDARERVAAALDAHPTEVVFTSGGTESVNLALKGAWWAGRAAGRSAIVLPEGEHHATLDAVAWLEREGATPRTVPIDRETVVDVEGFRAALAAGDAAVATSLFANNETGALQPVADLARDAAEAGVPLHVDAVAAAGHVPVSFARVGATMLSVSSHKLGGPAGIGALLVARSASLEPLHHGGGQQRGLRSGTQDAVLAHGFAVALEAAVSELDHEAARLGALTDRVLEVATALEGVERGTRAARVPGIAHLVVEGVEQELLTFLLDEAGFAVSNGSACTAGVQQPSHVMLAAGRTGAPLRISLGKDSTEEDVAAFLPALEQAIATARPRRH